MIFVMCLFLVTLLHYSQYIWSKMFVLNTVGTICSVEIED